MDIDGLSCNVNVLAITLEDGLNDEFELDEEPETNTDKQECKPEKIAAEDYTGLNETDINRETELLDDFRHKLLENRGGEITEESSLLRDLKDLKEKSLERKRARRLKKLKVKFQDPNKFCPFQRSCCNNSNSGKCMSPPNKKAGRPDSGDNSAPPGWNGSCHTYNNKCRQLVKMSSIDLYGCIIPKEYINC